MTKIIIVFVVVIVVAMLRGRSFFEVFRSLVVKYILIFCSFFLNSFNENLNNHKKK